MRRIVRGYIPKIEVDRINKKVSMYDGNLILVRDLEHITVDMVEQFEGLAEIYEELIGKPISTIYEAERRREEQRQARMNQPVNKPQPKIVEKVEKKNIKEKAQVKREEEKEMKNIDLKDLFRPKDLKKKSVKKDETKPKLQQEIKQEVRQDNKESKPIKSITQPKKEEVKEEVQNTIEELPNDFKYIEFNGIEFKYEHYIEYLNLVNKAKFYGIEDINKNKFIRGFNFFTKALIDKKPTLTLEDWYHYVTLLDNGKEYTIDEYIKLVIKRNRVLFMTGDAPAIEAIAIMENNKVKNVSINKEEQNKEKVVEEQNKEEVIENDDELFEEEVVIDDNENSVEEYDVFQTEYSERIIYNEKLHTKDVNKKLRGIVPSIGTLHIYLSKNIPKLSTINGDTVIQNKNIMNGIYEHLQNGQISKINNDDIIHLQLKKDGSDTVIIVGKIKI